MIKLKSFVVSRWKRVSGGEYRLIREIITAVSEKEASRICDIRRLNEVVQTLK